MAEAATLAQGGFAKRREGASSDAAARFEAAYRCMPPDGHHDARWEYLVSYLDSIRQQAPDSTRLCAARTLVEDFVMSAAAAVPRPDAVTFAEAELSDLDAELARLGSTCTPPLVAATPKSSAPLTPPVAQPEAAAHAPAPAVSDAPPATLDPKNRRARSLWIAGAASGAGAVAFAVVMAVGLRAGSRAEDQSTEAKASGDLWRVHTLRADGAAANRLAYTGAIVGGVLLVTSVALLVAASRRGPARRSPSRLKLTGAGVQVRF